MSSGHGVLLYIGHRTRPLLYTSKYQIPILYYDNTGASEPPIVPRRGRLLFYRPYIRVHVIYPNYYYYYPRPLFQGGTVKIMTRPIAYII